ncbi:ead/Ea22-like family protein [Klebsiella pneumoniae]|uniref:ead/Ea22-like family protein n=1 Tax=Klebsiella pneumoniae TaxID=573 RepID=UPI001B3413B7|nr:ead/Ea22-like family protein [Klebsiella pneumoniae]MBP4108540.1 ead/Ea22-like family protein [Klebsiella pneumoniae]
MTDITELAQRMKAAAEKATPGEWWADEVKNEGCYGSGDDCVEGFTSYAIYGADGKALFDSLNSDAACISEEYDGEGHVAWDETAQRNAEFIALANPANILALVEALEKAQQRIDELENDEVRQRLANAEHQLYMAELAKHNLKASRKAQFRKRRAAEKRIAELESRTVKLPKPKNSDQGWKIDPEFINKVQDAIGYDDTCECWEGTPSMELVEAVLLAAAGIKVETE